MRVVLFCLSNKVKEIYKYKKIYVYFIIYCVYLLKKISIKNAYKYVFLKPLMSFNKFWPKPFDKFSSIVLLCYVRFMQCL